MSLRDFLLGIVVGGVAPLLWLMLRSRDRSEPGVRDVVRESTSNDFTDVDRRMAYGEYDAAAKLLLNDLAREPRRADLKLKLLEVYFVWGNEEQFLATARRFTVDLRGTEEWAKVLVMGEQLCPDDLMFQR